jgi:predicted cupin superfamily sugar epimerase
MQPIDLVEHPEGGRFREVFRSARDVTTPRGQSRAALTHIYFSLRRGEVSRLHRVSADEVWNLYRGELRLTCWVGDGGPPERILLSATANRFCHVVPAGSWQAAEPLAEEVLVGCSVAPGFTFADFELMRSGTETARRIVGLEAGMARFLVP